jgi:hypothetical protein
MLGARFVGDGAGDAPDQCAVPGGAEPDDLRKDGRATAATNAMTGLAPPIVGGHPQTFDGTVLMEQLADLLQQGEAGEEIVAPRAEWQIGVQEGKSG